MTHSYDRSPLPRVVLLLATVVAIGWALWQRRPIAQEIHEARKLWNGEWR